MSHARYLMEDPPRPPPPKGGKVAVCGTCRREGRPAVTAAEPCESINWRALMVRYVAAVCEAEGVDFLDQIPDLTPEESTAVADLEPDYLAVLNRELRL